MHFYCKNYLKCFFIVRILFNAFYVLVSFVFWYVKSSFGFTWIYWYCNSSFIMNTPNKRQHRVWPLSRTDSTFFFHLFVNSNSKRIILLFLPLAIFILLAAYLHPDVLIMEPSSVYPGWDESYFGIKANQQPTVLKSLDQYQNCLQEYLPTLCLFLK